MLNYWKQFADSGKIEDYLSYIDQEHRELIDTKRQSVDAGAQSYAGIHMCDRNNIKADVYRGI